MRGVYYNENDAYAAAWLRNLIAAGHLPTGDVDERSIADVQAEDLEGYIQCHFFAGIGGWPLALDLAGFPRDRPCWTGSCPCQPFSGAGKQQGEKDSRHLWPEFLRLIVEWDVPTIFGEQVASALGRQWLDGVCADLEALDYRVGAADLSAAGAGAPHIRQRLYWVAHGERRQSNSSFVTNQRVTDPSTDLRRSPDWLADADQGQRGRLADGEGRERNGSQAGRQQGDGVAAAGGVAGGLAQSSEGRRAQLGPARLHEDRTSGHDAARRGEAGGLADADDGLARHRHLQSGGQHGLESQDSGVGRVGDTSSQGLAQRSFAANGHGTKRHEGSTPATSNSESAWSRYDVVHCTDGKTRRIEPAIFPLAHAGDWGTGSRVGMLRAAGNAIAPPLAKLFIEAYLDLVA